MSKPYAADDHFDDNQPIWPDECCCPAFCVCGDCLSCELRSMRTRTTARRANRRNLETQKQETRQC